jgi:hypothetical protein
MSIPEMWKLLKDFEFTNLINQEENKALVRIVNTDIVKKSKDMKLLDFYGFQQYLI